MATELPAALEAVSGVKPRIVHDHGSEFVNRDVAAVIKTHNLIDIKTRPRHPESNGIVERFNGTVRDELTTITATTICKPRRSSPSSCTITTRSDCTLPWVTWHRRPGIVANRIKFETSVRGESLRPVRIVK